MNRKITQKIFNDLVKETMEDFSMEADEAVDFAVSQLEAQEVNISNVIADVAVVQGTDAISQFAEKYNNLQLNEDFDFEECSRSMDAAAALADKSLKYKIHAGEKRIHTILLALLHHKMADSEFILKTLSNLALITRGYPDLIDNESMEKLLKLKDIHEGNVAISRTVYQILLNAIVQHENNKQMFFKYMSEAVIEECIARQRDEDISLGCKLITELCTDNDVRVEFSENNPRALKLADNFMIKTYNTLKLRQCAEVTENLLAAVASMAVNSTLVETLFELDPEFRIANEILSSFRNDENIIKNANRLLIALSRDDKCRSRMILLVPGIVRVLDQNMANANVLKSSLLAISSLCLRSRENSAAFISTNGLEKIIQAMKAHKNVKVRKYGCMALRNMASSFKDVKPFEEVGVGELANEILQSGQCNEECKALLVALGAPVNLTERWTGVRGDIVGGN